MSILAFVFLCLLFPLIWCIPGITVLSLCFRFFCVCPLMIGKYPSLYSPCFLIYLYQYLYIPIIYVFFKLSESKFSISLLTSTAGWFFFSSQDNFKFPYTLFPFRSQWISHLLLQRKREVKWQQVIESFALLYFKTFHFNFISYSCSFLSKEYDVLFIYPSDLSYIFSLMSKHLLETCKTGHIKIKWIHLCQPKNNCIYNFISFFLQGY